MSHPATPFQALLIALAKRSYACISSHTSNTGRPARPPPHPLAGNGLVVYMSERVGLVLVDRNTVVVGPCDVNLSFGAHPAEVPARVRFLHPLHNFALASFDPAALPPEARAKVGVSRRRLMRGHRAGWVGEVHTHALKRACNLHHHFFASTLHDASTPKQLTDGKHPRGVGIHAACLSTPKCTRLLASALNLPRPASGPATAACRLPGRCQVRAAELLSSPPLKRGEVVQLVGLTKHLRVMQRTSTVINATAALNLGAAEVGGAGHRGVMLGG